MKKTFLTLSVATLLLLPISSKAASTPVSLPFGGFVTVMVPCTCPPFGLWIFYSPLFLGSGVPIAGALYYPPGSLLYAFFKIGVPTTWALGSFIAGPGACSIIVGPSCVPLPAMGTIEFTGTSIPGALPY